MALDGTVADCTDDSLHLNLDGARISNIASIYAHAVFSEDGIINGMLQGKAPIFHADGWGAKLSVQMPTNPAMDVEWGREVRMELPLFREYAKAVFANTEAYVAGMSDQEFERKITAFGGERMVGWIVANILGTHAPTHMGEIAALKGVQGLKGLPF